MSNFEPSSESRLWSDIVEEAIETGELGDDFDRTMNYSNCSGSEVKHDEPFIDQVAPTSSSENNQMDDKEPLASLTPHSEDLQMENNSQTSGAPVTPRSQDLQIESNSQTSGSTVTPQSEDLQMENNSQACGASVTPYSKDGQSENSTQVGGENTANHSDNAKNEEKQSQTEAPQASNYIDNQSSFSRKTQQKNHLADDVSKDRMPSQSPDRPHLEDSRAGFSIQESASSRRRPAENNHKQMIHMNELDIMRNKLQKKNFFLTQEKERRIAAEDVCERHWKKLSEVELTLEDKRHLRLSFENELQQCKDTIEDLHQSSKALKQEAESRHAEAHKLALTELENLKKQLKEKASTNLQLVSKLKAQEEMTEDLEWKVAELSVKLKSALVAVKIKPDINAGAPESSAKDKVQKQMSVTMKTLSTQTEDFAPEKISAPEQESSLQLDVIDEFPDPEEYIRTRYRQLYHDQPQASLPEGDSERPPTRFGNKKNKKHKKKKKGGH